MAYTKQERKIIHKLLVGAKEHLWHGDRRSKGDLFRNKQVYICFAVEEFSVRNCIWGRNLVRNMIERRLVDRHGLKQWDVEAWLAVVAGVPKKRLTTKAVQTYRREWLDHLIKEFSE